MLKPTDRKRRLIMLKIGEFSKLSLTSVKALRFYEQEGLLAPAYVDAENGYRYYESAQLQQAARIRSLKALGLSLGDIKAVFSGEDERDILIATAGRLKNEMQLLESRLLAIRQILEDKKMTYTAFIKEVPETICYYTEKKLEHISDIMSFIPACGEACLRLNPGLICADPPYEFLEYPDGEYRESDVSVRHNEAVTQFGQENEEIRFRTIPAAKLLCVQHKGPYELLGKAYAFLQRFAEENGFTPAGLIRESYIDGIWNKESADDWLTEIQLPIQ